MGMCYETRADRTRYIIDEDYRIKQAMIRTFQNYSKQQQDQLSLLSGEKQFEYNKERNNQIATKPLNNNEKIISKNSSKLEEIYKLEHQIGEGGYGQVFLVRHKKMNMLRAMKIIPVNSKNEEEKTDEEIELLRQLDHPNIVKIFEYFSDEDKYYLITEYCRGGDLFDLIKKKRKFSEMSAAYIMYQIFRALFYCHSTHHLMHRDIKPENIP
jgi:calcium-dependent protein kinase